MKELNYPETTKHVIIHDEIKYTHHIVEPQNCLATGSPYMEIFDSEEDARQFYPQAFLTPEPEPDLIIDGLNVLSPDIDVE